MEAKLNEQIESNVSLSAQMSGFQRDAILADVSWDLSEAAKEKLSGLSESVEFESEASFRQKLDILKESFVETEAALPPLLLPKSSPSLPKFLRPTAEEGMSATMAAYVRGLGPQVITFVQTLNPFFLKNNV